MKLHLTTTPAAAEDAAVTSLCGRSVYQYTLDRGRLRRAPNACKVCLAKSRATKDAPPRRAARTSVPEAGIAEALRGAVQASKLPQSEIARRSGLEASTVSRFLGGLDILLGSADRLAGAMGLRFAAVPLPPGRAQP